MQDDKTFKQALEEVKTRIAQELYDAASARINMLVGGATIVEAVADIQDERKREAVQDFLLYVRVTALISSMEALDLLNRKQVDELLAYLNEHLQS